MRNNFDDLLKNYPTPQIAEEVWNRVSSSIAIRKNPLLWFRYENVMELAAAACFLFALINFSYFTLSPRVQTNYFIYKSAQYLSEPQLYASTDNSPWQSWDNNLIKEAQNENN